MKIDFITFASSNYDLDVKLVNSSINHTIYNESDLPSEFFKCVLSRNSRGYGLWIWKPMVILKHLATMDEGDILVYHDADIIVRNVAKKWMRLWRVLKEKDMIVFNTYHLEKNCTNQKTIVALNAECKRFQTTSSFIIMKKCKKVEELMSIWKNLMLDYPWMVLGSKTHLHRHDQSIFSCLLFGQKNINVYYEMEDCFSRSPFGGQIAIDNWQGRKCFESYCRWVLKKLYKIIMRIK